MNAVEPIAACVHEQVVCWEGERSEARHDLLATEEPLEIRLAGFPVAVTMRTPGNDLDLAAGFLFTEGIVRHAGDIASIASCPADSPAAAGNIVNVNPVDPTNVNPEQWRRNFYMTSSCGVCGAASIDALRRQVTPLKRVDALSISVLYSLARELRRTQSLFQQTGGLHAAALFTREGRLLVAREDVGRHNAVDKVIGAMMRQDMVPLDDHVLLVSSRASFEIVQKAWVAGIPFVAAVSAASSLAVETARAAQMTLVGFLRVRDEGGRFNVYAGEEWIVRG